MRLKTFLITGGVGYIGVHASFALLERGYNVYVIDSLINSSENTVNKIYAFNKSNNTIKNKSVFKFYKGDIRDLSNLEFIFSKAKHDSNPIDAVLHFAGMKSVSESMQIPLIYWDTNLLGTINLVKIMDKYKCYNLVFSSSASVYDSNAKSPLRETTRINPISPYGNSKASIEGFLEDVFKSKNNSWRICLLRYFNPIGSHPSYLIGEETSNKSTNIFPIICKSAFYKNQILNIFGKDWPTKDGTCVRDYIHVVDLVEGHILAIEYIIKSKPQIIALNLGTGIGISVLELINVFQNVNNCLVPFQFEKRRQGDVAICYSDNNYASKILKWKPQKTLEQMCKDGWEWYKNNL